jgi:hypothetical protein
MTVTDISCQHGYTLVNPDITEINLHKIFQTDLGKRYELAVSLNVHSV